MTTASAADTADSPDMPALDAAAVPTSVVHAWHDELIPAAGVIEWARKRSASTCPASSAKPCP